MSLSSILAAVPAELVADVADLVEAIIADKSPSDALARAKAAVITDAADAAADAALRRMLDKSVHG